MRVRVEKRKKDIFEIFGDVIDNKENIDCVFGLIITANQEIVGLDVSVNDSLFMDYFDSLDQLDSNVEYSCQVKFSPAFLE